MKMIKWPVRRFFLLTYSLIYFVGLTFLASVLSNILPRGNEEQILAAPSCNYIVSSNSELGSANQNATAGEIICLKTGNYSIPLVPSHSGSENNYITYEALPGETPVITVRVFLSGKSYLVFKGIEFRSAGGTAWIGSDTSSHHIQILGCKFTGGKSWVTIKGDYFTIRDCAFGLGQGDMILVEGAYALIEHNDFSQSGSDHSLLGIKGGHATHVIVRRNYFRSHWDRALVVLRFEGIETQRVIVEENVFVDNLWNRVDLNPYPNDPEDGGVEAIRFSATKNIFRNNLIIGTNIGSDSSSNTALQFIIFSGGGEGKRLWAEHTRVYNNTFFKNRKNGITFRRYADITSGYFTEDNIFKNNILAESRIYAVKVIDSGFSYLFDTNLISDTQKIKSLYIVDGGGEQSVAEAQSRHPGQFFGNITTPPLFQNESILDDALQFPENYSLANLDGFFSGFFLRTSSPGKEGGTHLTTVSTPAANTNILKVEDALYFSDGLGLIPGDSLIFGSRPNQPVRVNRVINETTLELNRAITLPVGDKVYLENMGTKPDMGIYGDGVVSPTPTPPPSFSLSQGWNEIIWPEVSGVKASDTPPECPIAVAKENFWFRPYVRNYGGVNFEFESGKTYYLKCSQETVWSL